MTLRSKSVLFYSVGNKDTAQGVVASAFTHWLLRATFSQYLSLNLITFRTQALFEAVS